MKKLITLFLTNSFLCGSLVTMLSFENNSFNRTNATSIEEQHLIEEASKAVSIGRNELFVDIQSVTSTSVSKTATISFSSTRITGWGTPKKNTYIVIDDPDYSGSPSSPSISGTPHPVFNGYTVEILNIETASFKVDKETTTKVKELVIPLNAIYGDTFSIKNNTILKNSFVFGDDEPKFENILIPDGINKIEAGAFKNIPDSVTVKCESVSKPDGWDDEWCDAQNIVWGYKFKGKEDTGSSSGNEVDYKTVNIGVYTNYYGELVKTPSDSTNTVYSVINDVNWSKDFDNPVRTADGLNPPYCLEGYVARIEDNESNPDVVIPEIMTYGEKLKIKNTRIANKAIQFAKNELGEYEANIHSITIPNGIEIIDSNAFYHVPDSVTIYCEAASKPDLWNDRWTDAKNIVWGYSVDPSTKTCVCGSIDKDMRLGNDATSYILGYKYEHQDLHYCPKCKEYVVPLVDDKCPVCDSHTTLIEDVTPEFQKPLIVSYDIKDKRSSQVIRSVWEELPLLSEDPTSISTSYFDSCKTSALSRTFDILLEENEQFDPDSLVVYNIYRAKSVQIKGKYIDEDGNVSEKYSTYVVPETQVQFKASAKKRYNKEVDFTEVLTNEFTGVTAFAGTTMISSRMNKVLPSYWYKGIPAETQEAFKEKLANGEYSIRYALYNLNNSFYRIKYYSPSAGEEVVCTMPINTPNSVVILEKDTNNSVSFLINDKDVYYENELGIRVFDFASQNLRQFEIIGLVVNIHLWNNAQSIKVSKSDVSLKFGALEVMPYSFNGPSVYKITTFVWIFVAGFTVLYAAIAVSLFFILKNKFKNDEFRRVKPKQYLKTSILGYVGSIIIALTVVFICFRSGRFSNAISVHNPLDVYIVVPGIISIVVIGYFIKFIIDKVKANKKRKSDKKLKIGKDVVDDGTN